MSGHFRKKISILSLLACTLGIYFVPAPAMAGWGAIACNSQNANCGVSYGWPSLATAEAFALTECLKGNMRCHIYRWEHNTCIRGPYGAYTCN